MEEHRFRPAWRSFYWHILAIVACFVIVVLLTVKGHLSPGYRNGLWIFFLVFVLCAGADMMYRRFRVLLIVKPDEIALEDGLIGRHSTEISTKNIRTIQVKQNVIQRILNVGDILVASAGTDSYEISIYNMYAPQDVRNLMQVHERAVDASEDDGE